MSSDPNKTVLGAPVGDPNRTQAMTGFDPARTTAMAATSMPGGPSLSVAVTPSREATLANGPAREQFLVEVTAGSGNLLPGVGDAGPRTAINLCLAIDRSGSMEGSPLEYVKQACQYVVDMLSPNDVLSIVTFEETVDLLMPPQRVTNKQPIKDGIGRLIAGNTTDLYGGISMAAQQLGQTEAAGRATRMVVLSDGDPTTGIKDFASLVQLAADIKGRGITVTFLGFGPDYNEELLASMSKKAGGNYYFIPRPELIPEIFRTELDKLMTVAAGNLAVELTLARWVSLRGATGLSVIPTERTFSIPLTDVERGSTIQVVVDLEFNNHPLGWYRVAHGNVAWDDTQTGRRERQDLDLTVEFTADAARYGAPVDPRVAQAYQIASASRAVEKTIMGLKTQQITAAAAIADLQKTQALLVQQGRTSEAQEVTMALRALQLGDAGTAEKTLMGTIVNLDQGKTGG